MVLEKYTVYARFFFIKKIFNFYLASLLNFVDCHITEISVYFIPFSGFISFRLEEANEHHNAKKITGVGRFILRPHIGQF